MQYKFPKKFDAESVGKVIRVVELANPADYGKREFS
jgi:hypothetical protein